MHFQNRKQTLHWSEFDLRIYCVNSSYAKYFTHINVHKRVCTHKHTHAVERTPECQYAVYLKKKTTINLNSFLSISFICGVTKYLRARKM